MPLNEIITNSYKIYGNQRLARKNELAKQKSEKVKMEEKMKK